MWICTHKHSHRQTYTQTQTHTPKHTHTHTHPHTHPLSLLCEVWNQTQPKLRTHNPQNLHNQIYNWRRKTKETLVQSHCYRCCLVLQQCRAWRGAEFNSWLQWGVSTHHATRKTAGAGGIRAGAHRQGRRVSGRWGRKEGRKEGQTGGRMYGRRDSKPCGEYYLLPAGGTTWSRSLGLVRFQIFLITARSSSLAWSMLPSVLILREVRTSAKRVALNITVPSLFRGMFMLTRRWTENKATWATLLSCEW